MGSNPAEGSILKKSKNYLVLVCTACSKDYTGKKSAVTENCSNVTKIINKYRHKHPVGYES